MTKGIILAGGRGSRLYPVTLGCNKVLLPVFDKPMIYYPLSLLMTAGIRDILLITDVSSLDRFKATLGDGSHLGIHIEYAVQEKPRGIAESFLIGESFIQKEQVALVLGDNILHGHNLDNLITEAASQTDGATVFGYPVADPNRYGVLELNEDGCVTDIVEKPENAPSNYAVPGIYFYDHHVVEYAKEITPSDRGELEITDINKCYLRDNKLHAELLGTGFAWLDAGTAHSLQQAASYVQTIQERQGIKIACVEEIAYRKGYITTDQLEKLAKRYSQNEYGAYLSLLISKETVLL